MRSRWEGKGNYRCESSNTFISSILLFLFVFAFTATFGRPEVKNEVAIWLHVQVAESLDTGIQEMVRRLNKCLHKGGDYVEK